VDIQADPLQIRRQKPTNLALIEGGQSISYGELCLEVDRMQRRIDESPPGLMAIAFSPTIDSVVTYLSALASQRPLVLLEPGSTPANTEWLFRSYDPAIITGFTEKPDGFEKAQDLYVRIPDTLVTTPCLCLTTSGSTGSPKLVRLAYSSVSLNAQCISLALDINEGSRAITSLPLNYSYGLSVLNSHLFSGASVVLTTETILSRDFWHLFDVAQCTSFAGVPYSYSLLKRLRFSPDDHPSLQVMTQAGGKLDVTTRQHFHDLLDGYKKQFIIMYGQTEATARMSILPHNDFLGHEDSAGKAIPMGSFKILDELGEDLPPGYEGQIVYQGPNVMDCYVSNVADFDQSPKCHGELFTGDRGFLDTDGFLYITGREKRIGKIHGTRINLDEVEDLIHSDGFICAVTNLDEVLHFFFENQTPCDFTPKDLAQKFKVHSSSIKIHRIASLPLLSSGKVDYPRLEYLISN